jgi:5-methylcytosine-specific restriction endonuclease McrA
MRNSWPRLKRLCGGRCYYCGVLEPNPHLEHRTPLVRGGKHEGRNLVPACPTCNMRKGTRTEAEYLAATGWEKPEVFAYLTRRHARDLRRVLKRGW